MSLLVLLNANILVGGTDLTAQSNELELSGEVDALDSTTFGTNGWKALTPGLREASFKVKGFWYAGDITLPDDSLFQSFGTSVPATISPVPPVVGEVAYLMRGTRGNYKWGAEVGKLLPFEAGLAGNGALARGVYGATGVKTTTGNGAGQQLGAVSATQQLVAALHVEAVSGSSPTLAVIVQSSVDNTFASPTTRITFTSVTGSGAGSSQWLAAAGPITDTWYRVVYTIGGSSPSFDFTTSVGIAPK